MINRWRYLRYTDDGCSAYQCLNCYRQWEGRSTLGFHQGGEYHAIWRFCPYCGIEWNGPIREASYDNKRMLGERRLRRKKLERQAWDAWDDQRYDYSIPSTERAKIPRYDERHITHWWSLQVQEKMEWDKKSSGPPIVEYRGIVTEDDGGWKTQLAWKGGMMPTRKMWHFVKEEMERQRNNHDEIFYQWVIYVRLLVTKNRPPSGYICENYTLPEEQ